MFESYKRSALRTQAFGITLLCSCMINGFLMSSAGQAAAVEPGISHTVSEITSTQKNAINPAQGSREYLTANLLFVSSGLKELVAQIPTSTASSFESALTVDQLPDLFRRVDQKAIRGAVNNAFKSETFDKYLVKELRNAMSGESREKMLAWYASSLGTKVKQAELDNSLLTEQTRFEEYQIFLRRYPVDVVREQLVQTLDATMQSTESAVEMMTNIQVAFNLSLSRFMPEQYRLSRQEILNMVAQDQEGLSAQYQQQTKEVLLFTYQGLSNEELVQLSDTLATDAGQDFVVAINNGIKKGMFAASLDLGDGLGALIDTSHQGPGI